VPASGPVSPLLGVSGFARPRGAIDIGSGSLLLDRATVTGNFSGFKGGGILAGTGTVTLSASTVKLNTARSSGGGIDSEGGTVTLAGSSVRRNQAQGDGGGIFALGGGAVLTNSSVTGNHFLSSGGGIAAVGLNLISSTINENTAGGDDGGVKFVQWLPESAGAQTPRAAPADRPAPRSAQDRRADTSRELPRPFGARRGSLAAPNRVDLRLDLGRVRLGGAEWLRLDSRLPSVPDVPHPRG